MSSGPEISISPSNFADEDERFLTDQRRRRQYTVAPVEDESCRPDQTYQPVVCIRRYPPPQIFPISINSPSPHIISTLEKYVHERFACTTYTTGPERRRSQRNAMRVNPLDEAGRCEQGVLRGRSTPGVYCTKYSVLSTGLFYFTVLH